MEHEKVERISELTRISRTRELTDEEKREREALRREYLDGFRRNMIEVLESTRVQRPDGTLEPLRKKDEPAH